MQYTEVQCRVAPAYREALIGYLSAHGFESFQETTDQLKAYLPKSEFNPAWLKQIQQQIKDQLPFHYKYRHLDSKNWNKEWEKHFKPIEIDNICRIRAPFHNTNPNYPYEIIINPQQSFGTGHHATTRLMIRAMHWIAQRQNINRQSVLDIGCGTGILSIFARQLGAVQVVAIDNNEWAYHNTHHNLQHNNVQEINVYLADIFSGQFFNKIQQNVKFDLILANINKSHILKLLKQKPAPLEQAQIFIASGFYNEAISSLCQAAQAGNFILKQTFREQEWAGCIFQKSNL
jgi:ribosomal protein L11 methyltransferase